MTLVLNGRAIAAVQKKLKALPKVEPQVSAAPLGDVFDHHFVAGGVVAGGVVADNDINCVKTATVVTSQYH